MKKYKIRNIGCDDETEGIFEFTEEQYNFLNKTFEELNKNSNCGCMPEIYIDPTDKYVGMTLAEIGEEQRRYKSRNCIDDCAVMVLQDEKDSLGELLSEDFSIGWILSKYPEYANCKVKYTNDFNGITVLRVEKCRVDE